ncbi:MAG: TetR/AcrR family transcriptional regulator [Phaeodactylibacter sp.]|nr:TetR/AcrR family transcriptional regulator [Phaeodactylibacter sp.]
MKNTKEKILETALELFNRHGYAQVTIRMIAQAAGMSSGNLNYHFRKREDILEALYFEMVEVFDRRVADLTQAQFSFSQILADIRSSMERMAAYRFFWADLHYLLKSNANIRAHFNRAYERRKAGYAFLFTELQRQALMRPPDFAAEYDFLAERMLAYSDTWIYAAQWYEEESIAKGVEKHATALLLFLYPQLTEKGKEEVRGLVEREYREHRS